MQDAWSPERLLGVIDDILAADEVGDLRQVIEGATGGIAHFCLARLRSGAFTVGNTITTLPAVLEERALEQLTRAAQRAGADVDNLLRQTFQRIAVQGAEDGELEYMHFVELTGPAGTQGFGAYFLSYTKKLTLSDQRLLRILSAVVVERIGRAQVQGPSRRLTPRQVEALALCAHGMSDWDISQVMCVSTATVHGHIEEAKRRLGVRTRIQAVLVALRLGLIDEPF